MKSNQPLKFTIHLSMFLRSFLVQALWNYRSMQSLGICFMLLPLRVKLDKSSEIFREFIAENIKFVNSHPYFAGYLVGMLSKLYLQEGDAVIQKAEKLKNLLVSPLGSIGDKLFWENIKPSMMLLAVPGAIFQLQGYPGWILMALAFAGYNLPHLIIRWIGIKQGYTLGYQIYNKLNFESFEKMYKLYLNIGKVMWLLGFALTLCMVWISFKWVIIPVFLINFLLTVFIYHYTHSVFRYLGMLLILNVALTQIFTG